MGAGFMPSPGRPMGGSLPRPVMTAPSRSGERRMASPFWITGEKALRSQRLAGRPMARALRRAARMECSKSGRRPHNLWSDAIMRVSSGLATIRDIEGKDFPFSRNLRNDRLAHTIILLCGGDAHFDYRKLHSAHHRSQILLHHHPQPTTPFAHWQIQALLANDL